MILRVLYVGLCFLWTSTYLLTVCVFYRTRREDVCWKRNNSLRCTPQWRAETQSWFHFCWTKLKYDDYYVCFRLLVTITVEWWLHALGMLLYTRYPYYRFLHYYIIVRYVIHSSATSPGTQCFLTRIPVYSFLSTILLI